MIGSRPPGAERKLDEAAPRLPGVTLLDIAPGWTDLREAWPGGSPQAPWIPLGDWLDRVVLAEDRPGVRGAIASALAGPTELAATFRGEAADGLRPWMQVRATQRPQGIEPLGWDGALVDVTSSVRATEARVRAGGAEALSRARNTLAAIRAVLRLDVAPGLAAADLAMMTDGRAGALARVLVGFGPDAPAGRTVEAVLRDELVAAAVREAGVRIDGPPVWLAFRPAQVLALAFHDLALVSLGDGALAVPDGHLEVTWEVEGADEAPVLSLEWAEAAASLRGSAGRATGLDLVERMLAYDGGSGALVEDRAGRRAWRVRLPLGLATGWDRRRLR